MCHFITKTNGLFLAKLVRDFLSPSNVRIASEKIQTEPRLILTHFLSLRSKHVKPISARNFASLEEYKGKMTFQWILETDTQIYIKIENI